MTELITQLILYAYPLWALVAFAMSLVNFATWYYLDGDYKMFLWGVIFLGWSLAFFGAGLLIAQVGARSLLVPIIQAVWIVILPVFAVAVGIECVQLWRILRRIEAAHQRRKIGK